MMEQFDLKEYVKNVYSLETLLVQQDKTIEKINNEINIYKLGLNVLGTSYENTCPYRYLIQERYIPKLSNYIDSGIFYEILGIYMVLVFVYMTVFHGLLDFHQFIMDLVQFEHVHLLIVSFIPCMALAIVCRLGFAIFKYLKDSHNIKRENISIKEENEKIQKHNEYHLSLRNKQLANYQKQKSIMTRNYYDTKRILEDVYDMNIIYPKYRNLIAVSSFCEYLNAGRCSTLEGHEGAYNIFENEIRLDLIINKLDLVLQDLERIKQNQYMLYTAIKESNRKADRIYNELTAIHDQNTDVLHSLEVSNYNSEIAAQNSEFLKWYCILKN